MWGDISSVSELFHCFDRDTVDSFVEALHKLYIWPGECYRWVVGHNGDFFVCNNLDPNDMLPNCMIDMTIIHELMFHRIIAPSVSTRRVIFELSGVAMNLLATYRDLDDLVSTRVARLL